MTDTFTTPSRSASVPAIPRLSRRGYWAIAPSFLVVTGFSTAPNRLYRLYEDHEQWSMFFTAGYAGLSVPVVGLGVALQHLSPRATLLIFAVAVGRKSWPPHPSSSARSPLPGFQNPT